MSTARKGKGRQKIEMKQISNEANLSVTFSKRRSGLFKKASELSTLCGAEMALIVFSPGEKVFSFGHPNVDNIIERFLMQAPPQNPSTIQEQFNEAQRNANICELNAQLTQVNSHLEFEKKRGDDLNHIHKANMAQFWWASPIQDLNNAQLDQLKVALGELKKSVAHKANKLLIQENVVNPAHLFSASSSSDVVNHLQYAPPALAPAPAPALAPAMVPLAPAPALAHAMAPQGFPSNMLQPVMNHQNPMMQNHLYNGNMMQHHAFNLNNMAEDGPGAKFF